MKVKAIRKTSDQAHNDDGDKVDDAEIDDIRERHDLYAIYLVIRSEI